MATIITQVRLPKGLLKELNKLVAKGFYTNKSDLIREALRQFVIGKEVSSQQNV